MTHIPRISRNIMSLIRPLCRRQVVASTLPTSRQIGIAQARWASYSSGDKSHDPSLQPAPKADSSDAPSARAGDSSMIRQEDSAEAMVEHQPDFRAPTDHGTS